MPQAHKPTGPRAHNPPPFAAPVAAPAVVKPFPARTLSTTPTALQASLFWASRLNYTDDLSRWHVAEGSDGLETGVLYTYVLDTEGGLRWAEGEVGFRVGSPR